MTAVFTGIDPKQDGTGLKQLTFDDAAEDFPLWSPDGRRIALTSDRDGQFGKDDIFKMSTDGTDP